MITIPTPAYTPRSNRVCLVDCHSFSSSRAISSSSLMRSSFSLSVSPFHNSSITFSAPCKILSMVSFLFSLRSSFLTSLSSFLITLASCRPFLLSRMRSIILPIVVRLLVPLVTLPKMPQYPFNPFNMTKTLSYPCSKQQLWVGVHWNSSHSILPFCLCLSPGSWSPLVLPGP